jgi:hypothetical protein
VAKSLAILVAPWLGFALLIAAIIIAIIIALLAWRISVAIVRIFKPSPSVEAAAVGAAVPFEQPRE